MLPILKDRRYIRIGDKPVLLVYRVDLLQRPVETAQTWRTLAAANGLPTCICVRSSRLGFRIRDSYGFDAALKFPPHGLALDSVEPQPPGVTLDFAGTIADFRAAARLATAAQAADYPLHRAVMVSWDNTPRRGKRGIIFQTQRRGTTATGSARSFATATHAVEPVNRSSSMPGTSGPRAPISSQT